jgi:pimeloyl-ACP methyl ester carboxylesterase
MGLPMSLYRAFPSEARLRRFLTPLLTSVDEDWLRYFGDAFLAYRLDMRIPPLATDAELAGLDLPVLAVGADEDLSFPGAALLARFRNHAPRAETELLLQCKHSPPFDDDFRARLGGRIALFLGANEPGDAGLLSSAG